MIADRTYRAASFLAARVKNRLRLAASTDHKAPQVLALRAFRLRGQEQTVSDGSWPASACSPVVTQSNPGLLSHFERVVYLDSKVSHRTFKLGMAPQQLDSAQIFGASID
jgi:hypothetical protein